MPWIEANGLSHRYLLEGKGPLVVLLPEMGGTLESWDGVVPGLVATGLQVLRYDLRNSGLSERQKAPFGFPDLAADLAGLQGALDLPVAEAVAGCAFGGAVALCFAARYPQALRSAFVMSPAVGVPAERKAMVLEKAAAMRGDDLRPTQDARLAAPWPEEFRGDGAAYRDLWLRRVAADPVGIARQLEVLAHADMDDDLARVRCPVTVLAGAQDRERPLAAVGATARRIGTGVRVTPVASGHFMTLQSPDLVRDALLAHLAGLKMPVTDIPLQ